MSRKQRAHGKEKNSKLRFDVRSHHPSNSAIWNVACQRADDLIKQGFWSEARDELEAVDRTLPGANAVLSRLAEVYEALGQMDNLALVNSRRKPELIRFEETRKLFEDQLQCLSVFNFEIDFEPIEVDRSPEVNEWACEAYQALWEGRGREAERLLKQCLEVEGDAPDLLNSLATAYSQQRRNEESCKLARQIHDRWPDYFFGRIAMANLAVMDGNFGLAKKHLEPLLAQRRYHISEYRALATAYIQLQIQLEEMDTAQIWIDVWKSVDPDHPQLKILEKTISGNSISNLLGRLFGLRRSLFDK